MKIYITRHALTAGILERDAEVKEYVDGTKLAYVKSDYSSYRLGADAFLNLEDAKKNAEERRLKKIESLKKQIKKLELFKIKIK